MNIPSSSISTTGHLKFAELMKEGFIQHIWSNTKGLSQRLGVCTTTRWPYKATNQRQVIHLLVSFFVKKSDATEHPHGYEKKRAPLCRCVFFWKYVFHAIFSHRNGFESSILENVFFKKTSNLLESNVSSDKNSSGDISLFGCRS